LNWWELFNNNIEIKNYRIKFSDQKIKKKLYIFLKKLNIQTYNNLNFLSKILGFLNYYFIIAIKYFKV
jgi:hypothetical protein